MKVLFVYFVFFDCGYCELRKSVYFFFSYWEKNKIVRDLILIKDEILNVCLNFEC